MLDWQKERWEPVGSGEHWFLISVDTSEVNLRELEAGIADRLGKGNKLVGLEP